MKDATPEQHKGGLRFTWDSAPSERAVAHAKQVFREMNEAACRFTASLGQSEIQRLRSLNARLAAALRALYDERTEAAMDKAQKILQEAE